MSSTRKVWPGPLKGETTTVVVDANYYAQLRNAEEWMVQRHKKLIEAGFEWDGMDGYMAPPGLTVEQMLEVMK